MGLLLVADTPVFAAFSQEEAKKGKIPPTILAKIQLIFMLSEPFQNVTKPYDLTIT